MSNRKATCEHSNECKACHFWHLEYDKQKALKINDLSLKLKDSNLSFDSEIDFISCGTQTIRHRFDFVMQLNESTLSYEFGFYNENKKLIPIVNCLQLSPELLNVFHDFMSLNFSALSAKPIKKASVRLRIGPTGLKGCWLDFSNLDIKFLLEEKEFIQQLEAKNFIVEMGQKRKSPHFTNDQFKLNINSPSNWFKTFSSRGEALPLFCHIADFTQVSWLSSEKIVSVLWKWLSVHSKENTQFIEFGSGIGPYTISLLYEGYNVDVFEFDSNSCDKLMYNVKKLGLDIGNLKISIGDFHYKKIDTVITKKFLIALVNPARSGLKNFCFELLKLLPSEIYYISCYPPSLIEDLKLLSEKYSICNITIIDQFPQTKHYETCIQLKLKT